MVERDERLVYRTSDLMRGHFQVEEIVRINIGMAFIKWALKQDRLKTYCFEDEYFRDGQSLGDKLKFIANCVEECYPILKGVLLSLLPNRFEQELSDLNAIVSAFTLPDWEEYSSFELQRLFNALVMDADGQDDVYSTPESIREIMCKLIKPVKNMNIADLFSGAGSCLARVFQEYKSLNPILYGEEINFDMFGISNMLFIINEVINTQVVQRNVYTNSEADFEKFDNVLMDSPFALSVTIEDSAVYKYGLPSKSAADWANYQIALSKLKPTGRAIATTSVGGLNRASDIKIREGIINDDLVEAIIMLPSSMYVNTAIPTAIIVFNKRKAESIRNKVIMIDASESFIRKNRRQNSLTQETINRIIHVVQNGTVEKQFSTVVDLETLRKNEYNLNASYYLNAQLIEQQLSNSILLKEIADILPGVQVPASDLEVLKKNATHYFLNVRNIQDDLILYEEEDRIRDKKVNWYGKYDIQAGDIIMTTKGTTAKAVIVPEDFLPAFISNNLTIIRVNKEKYSPYVLLKYLRSDLGRLVLDSVTTGAGVRIINASKLGNIEIPDYDTEKCLQLGDRIKSATLDYQKKIDAAKKKLEAEEKEISKELGF
jgi:type I restriction-modification system DNA methylase subunit